MVVSTVRSCRVKCRGPNTLPALTHINISQCESNRQTEQGKVEAPIYVSRGRKDAGPGVHFVSPGLLQLTVLRHRRRSDKPTVVSRMWLHGSHFHSVNLILFTVFLVHRILRISPHHHLHSHHLSLPLHFTPDLKLISFTNPFLHSHSYSFRTDFTDLNLYWIKGALLCFSFWLRVLD